MGMLPTLGCKAHVGVSEGEEGEHRHFKSLGFIKAGHSAPLELVRPPRLWLFSLVGYLKALSLLLHFFLYIFYHMVPKLQGMTSLSIATPMICPLV